MKLYRLQTVQRLRVSLEEAWEYFSDPGNLPEITPPWLGLQLTSQAPPKMHPGMIITYRVRPLPGIPVGWVTEITHVVEPYLFVDEQRLGPYRFWHHQHHFREIESGVEIRDLVHYALPLGPLGRVVQRWMVGRQLEKIFAFRREVLEARFEGEESA